MKKRRAVGLIAALGLLLGGCGANPPCAGAGKAAAGRRQLRIKRGVAGSYSGGNREGSGRIAEGAGAGKQRDRFL